MRAAPAALLVTHAVRCALLLSTPRAALPHIHRALALVREPPDGGRGDQIKEAAADALCTLGTHEACRPALVAQVGRWVSSIVLAASLPAPGDPP